MTSESIALFHPHIPKNGLSHVASTLRTRWIGQGPKVDSFEERFTQRFAPNQSCVAVGSGTDALHLAYVLAGLKEGDEVVTPVFTCTATNIPLLYQRATPVFADIQPDTMNIDPAHARSMVNERTKALVCVHYGGLPCDMSALRSIAADWNIPLIGDNAHAIGAMYQGAPISDLSDFSAYSFQAVKHITTGDGGMLTFADRTLRKKAERIRWFGIDRIAKHTNTWDNEIHEVGYKYQMTDIAAALGHAALDEIDDVLATRQELFRLYKTELAGIPNLKLVGAESTDRVHAAWACTILAENRKDLERKLLEAKVECGQVHYRNDRYAIFGPRRSNLPNMDAAEDLYLILPLHTKLSGDDVLRVCSLIRSGW